MLTGDHLETAQALADAAASDKAARAADLKPAKTLDEAIGCRSTASTRGPSAPLVPANLSTDSYPETPVRLKSVKLGGPRSDRRAVPRRPAARSVLVVQSSGRGVPNFCCC